MQHLVQLDRALVGLALDRAGLRVAAEQQVGLIGQIPSLDDLYQIVGVIEQRNLDACSDVQAGLDGAAIAQGDADTGVGTDQAAFADGYDDIAATRERTHGGAAAAEVRALADKDAGGYAAFDHAGARCASVEVDKALMHDRGAFAHIGAQAHPRGVGDTHASGHDVVGHRGELVDAQDVEHLALHARGQLALG